MTTLAVLQPTTPLEAALALVQGSTGSATGFGILGDPRILQDLRFQGGIQPMVYEVTGTQVALRETPAGTVVGYFNNKYGNNNNLVVEPVDTVDATGEITSAGGRQWALVAVKSGQLVDKSGWVAVDFLAPLGWTKERGGTGPIPPVYPEVPKPPATPEPSPAAVIVSKYAKYALPALIVGGVAAVGLLGYLVFYAGNGGLFRENPTRRRRRRSRRGKKKGR